MLSWAIVVLVSAFIAWTAMAGSQEEPDGTRRDDPSRMLVAGRYVVGVHGLFGRLGLPRQTDKLLAQMDATARTPADQFRAAIVRGELGGTEEARARIESLAQATPQLASDAAMIRALHAGEPLNPDAGEAWRDFEKRHGWFALLARAQGRAAGDPDRAAAMDPAYRTTAALLGAAAAGLGGAVLGLGLLILGAIALRTGRLRMAFWSMGPPDTAATVQGFAVYLVGLVALPLLLRDVLKLPAPLPAAGMLLALVLGLWWPRMMGQTAACWRAVLGWHAGRGVLRELGAGVVGYIGGLPIVLIGFIISLTLVVSSGEEPSHPVNEALKSGGTMTVALMFLLACVWAPITEELMFRGALLGHLRERFGWWFAAPVTALVFAVIHPQGWTLVPALAALALVFAGIRQWRGSILGCVMAHALHNGLTLTLAVMLFR